MESRELRLTQQPVENMTHLMEERDHIVMSHQRGF